MKVVSQIKVENIHADDVAEIIKLGLSTKELHLQEKKAIYYDEDEIKSFIKSPNHIYLVAKVGGKIAGYRLAIFNPFLLEAYLMDLVVKPEFRGTGVANALYAKTFEILQKKKCEWAWTLVKEGNERMMEILPKKGFVKGSKFQLFYKIKPFN